MKKVLFTFIFILFCTGVFAQVLRSLPKKENTELDIVFENLEKSGNTAITVNKIAELLDSLATLAVTGSGKKDNTYKIDGKGDTIYSIGADAHGGIVFWVDESGKHGLVAAPGDQTGGVTWFNGTTRVLRDGVYAGRYNTEQIINNKSVGYYAAKVCADYKGGGYDDWYLPSKYELNLLYVNRRVIGGFYRDYYWSSSEDDNDVSWLHYFYNGLQCSYYKYATTIYRVRPVRAF